MRSIILSSFLCLFLLLPAAFAETHITGTITDYAWTVDDGPYYLDSDVTLEDGSILSIEDGVEVLAAPYCAFYIEGEFWSEGVDGNPVLFTAQDPNQGWGGFIIPENENAIVFANTIIEYGFSTEGYAIHGGAMNARYCKLTMYNCEIRFNQANQDGGGIYLYHVDFDISGTLFHHNICGRLGSAVDFAGGDGGVFSHNVLAFNHAMAGGAILYYDGEHELDHITFYNNTGDQHASEFVEVYGGGTIENSILYNDVSQFPLGTALYGQVSNVANYCLTSDSSIAGTNQIYEDPMLVDPNNLDFHLEEDSPCIDAGNPGSPIDPDGTITDLGAYWYETVVGDYVVLAMPDMMAIPGHRVGIPLLIRGVDVEDDITAFEVEISLPMEYLDSLSVFPAPGSPILPGDGWMFDWNETEDGVEISVAGPSPLEDSGPIVAIVAMVSPSAPQGECFDLEFESAILNEGDPEVITRDGSLLFIDRMRGDVSDNGEVQAFDAAMILSHLAQGDELTEQEIFAADVSGDGTLSPLDAALILAYTVGNIDEFPAQNGQFWATGEGTPIAPEEVNASVTGTFTVPIQIEYAEDVLAATVDLQFDPTQINLAMISAVEPGASASYTMREDGARIYVARTAPVGENGTLLELSFRLRNVEESAQILCNNVTLNEYGTTDEVLTIDVFPYTDVDDQNLPLTHGLVDAYPNPFNPVSNVSISLQHSDRVHAVVFDALGREVVTLTNGYLPAGVSQLQWNAVNNASGTYFLRVSIGNETQMKALILMK